MEINTSTALLTACISSIFGFGLAFYMGKKLSVGLEKKSQRVLVTTAMMSFGFGLTAITNELVGFPLQGLTIRYDKLVIYFIVNIVMLPLVLIGISKLVQPKKIDIEKIEITTKGQVVITSRTAIFALVACALVVFLYFQFGRYQRESVYDFYFKMDRKNCNSPYELKPQISSKFVAKVPTSEVFWTAELDVDGVKQHSIAKLTECVVIDESRWSCKGDIPIPTINPSFTMVDGDLNYISGYGQCPVKVVKR